MGAPLRETLAAALVLLSRYRGKDPFCDPFCGSGTIPIEAALIAKNRAPGLDRRLCRPEVEDHARQAVAGRRGGGPGQGVPRQLRHLGRGHRPGRRWSSPGTTRRWRAWRTASASRRRTPRHFRRDSEYGQLVTNPPYGERLLEKAGGGGPVPLPSATPSGRCRRSGGWWSSPPTRSLSVPSAASAEKKRKLYNGMLKCDAFFYHGAQRSGQN